jgi:hypothetical protein
MDLHVRSASSPNRSSAVPGRSQPIRLQPARPTAPTAPAAAETVPDFQPINRAKSGPFAYEQGSFVLAGQTEVDPDGRSQVRGSARFQQGKLALQSEGRFILGYEGSETALIGEGEFVWKDGRGMPLTGRGTIAVRQDPQGNAIIQLDGTIATRHQTIAIEGPAQAEIDARSNGAFVVRLKGKARFGTPQATIDGDLDLTYGEVDGERLDAVTIYGRAQSRHDQFEAGGDAELARRWSYGRPNTVLTISGPGTYRHGRLVCDGQIVLRIVPHGTGEAFDGTVLGNGRFQDQGLRAEGMVSGTFFQFGDRHDFDGRLDGDLSMEAGPAVAASPGALELALRPHAITWQATPAGETTWRWPGLSGAMTGALWKRQADGTTTVSGTGALATSQVPWWLRLEGAIGVNDTLDGWGLSAAGNLVGGLVGGIAIRGPGKLSLDADVCSISGRVAEAADIAGATVPAGAPLELESGPLPDGRDFWHARLGGPARPLRLSAVSGPDGGVARIRQADPERPLDERLPLAALPPPPEPADEQAQAEADPKRPETQRHP